MYIILCTFFYISTHKRQREIQYLLEFLWAWSFGIIGRFQNTSGHAAQCSVGDLKIISFEVPSGVFRWFLMAGYGCVNCISPHA